MKKRINVIDLFCGCGGTSLGFQNAGFKIAVGLDIDESSAKTFRRNFPDARFIQKDIRLTEAEEIVSCLKLGSGSKTLLTGCAPCQPFSKINKNKFEGDERTSLIKHFQRMALEIRPDYIFLENVPGVQRVSKSESPFLEFIESLGGMGYSTHYKVVRCSDFGVPQRRLRLVLLASLRTPIAIPEPGPIRPSSIAVRSWISDLPPLEAGERCATIANHEAANLSEINLRRISSLAPERGRRDLPEEMTVNCHRNHVGHSDVYGRLGWDRPSAAITTRCISLSNGRFGHPEQHRAISAREAARLQTFPDHFIFEGSLTAVARQIGNAVPPLMAEKLAGAFL